MARQRPETVESANEKLKRLYVRLRIYKRGRKLSLRATLPPRPGEKRTSWYQQYISLNCYANEAGFQQAIALAIKIENELTNNSFDWRVYLRNYTVTDERTIGDLIEIYKQEFFKDNELSPTTLRSWGNILGLFKPLPQDQPLSEDIILQIIQAIPVNTPKREKACTYLKKLASFSGKDLQIDFKRLQGKPQTQERNIPSDSLIEEWFFRIPDPEWQGAYGIYAVFGLRTHELPYLDINDFRAGGNVIHVLKGTKTGERFALPLYPHWIEKFNLRELPLPQIEVEGKPNQDIGSQITQKLKKYGIPFTPYDMRHAWSIRSMDHMDLRTAAKSQGHSTRVHEKIYNAWYSKRDAERKAEKLKKQSYLDDQEDKNP